MGWVWAWEKVKNQSCLQMKLWCSHGPEGRMCQSSPPNSYVPSWPLLPTTQHSLRQVFPMPCFLTPSGSWELLGEFFRACSKTAAVVRVAAGSDNIYLWSYAKLAPIPSYIRHYILSVSAQWLSCVWLFGTPQDCSQPGFSVHGILGGFPFPSPGNLPDPGTKPTSLVSPALAGGFFINMLLNAFDCINKFLQLICIECSS